MATGKILEMIKETNRRKVMEGVTPSPDIKIPESPGRIIAYRGE
ncbi:MAG: hypothetical protein WC560_09580 [Syntrophales bacterium]